MARTRRLGYGEGSVYKELDPDTGEVIRWRGEGMVNGKRRRVSGLSRGQVVAKLDALRGEGGDTLPDRDVTVGAWLAWWLDRISAAKDPIAHRGDRWAVSQLAGIAPVHLAELRRVDVQKCLTDLAKRKVRPLGVGSLQKAKSVLAQAIDEAVDHHPELGVTRNVARGRWMPPEAAPAKGVREMTRAEARTLLDAAQGTDMEGMVTLMLHTPIRPGEVAGLRWGALDLAAGTMAIKEARRVMPDGEMVQGHVKAHNDRTVALPAVVVSALKAHQGRQRREKLAAEVWASPGDYVFCNAIGEPLRATTMTNMFSRFCVDAGVGPFSPNAARHATISFLVESGMPLQVVADLAGHTLEVMSRAYRYRVAGVIDATEAQARMLAP